MSNSGRALEQLVTRLEHVLAPSKDISIEPRKRVRDKRTGRLREHDVIITIREAHHSIIVALECRDRSRPVGVGDVEAFSRKCEDTGIDQGIIVSALGFYKTALRKAEAHRIRCLTMKEALALDWLHSSSMRSEEITVNRLDTNFVMQAAEPPKGLSDYALLDSSGIQVPEGFLHANAMEQLQLLRAEAGHVDSEEATFNFDGIGFSIRDNKTGELHPLKYMIVTVRYEVKVTTSPFKFFQYSDESSGELISDAAMASVEFDGQTAEVAFVKDAKTGIKVVLFPPPGVKIRSIDPNGENGT